MSAAGLATRAPTSHATAAARLTLGGPAALAESAWMGSPQASEVLEPLRLAAPSWRPAQMCLPSLRALPLRLQRASRT